MKIKNDLTKGQLEEIRQEAIYQICEACRSSNNLLKDFVEPVVNNMELQEKLEWISTEPDYVKQSLGFNPYEDK